jgi:hypothetical protein
MINIGNNVVDEFGLMVSVAALDDDNNDDMMYFVYVFCVEWMFWDGEIDR